MCFCRYSPQIFSTTGQAERCKTFYSEGSWFLTVGIWSFLFPCWVFLYFFSGSQILLLISKSTIRSFLSNKLICLLFVREYTSGKHQYQASRPSLSPSCGKQQGKVSQGILYFWRADLLLLIIIRKKTTRL